jgi:hypothetical protein
LLFGLVIICRLGEQIQAVLLIVTVHQGQITVAGSQRDCCE